MGTGIVATGAASLPAHLPGLRAIATVVWAVAAIALLTLIVAWSRQLSGAALWRYANDPVMIPFFGAPPMALMTVGAGTLLLGGDVLGTRVAVALDLVLWTSGTVLGLAVAVV